jgi:hypothetical protein
MQFSIDAYQYFRCYAVNTCVVVDRHQVVFGTSQGEWTMNARYGWKAMTQGTLAAACTIGALCASATAWADGGTIHFVGAIVAPTYGIVVGGGASSGASATLERQQGYDSATGVTTIVLTSEPNAAPRAELSVLTASGARTNPAAEPGRRVEVSFTDGSGRRVTQDVAGRYQVGASGGVLTLAAKQSGLAADAALATVQLDYR